MAEHALPELSEAKAQTRFDELLDRVERGEAFVITRNERPLPNSSRRTAAKRGRHRRLRRGGSHE